MSEQRPSTGEGHVVVVINGSAGRGDTAAARAAFERVRAQERLAIRVTDSAGVAPAVRTARALGAREVVVVGGDGTVQRSARVLAGEDVIMVAAPGGTLNHFSRRYGIETLEQAASLVGRGAIREVPLGVADDLLFLNTLVFGAYPSILRLRERLEDVIGRWPAAGIGFVAALLRRRQVRVVIETGTRRLERTTGMVWIGLGRGSWPLSHRIRRSIPEPVLEVAVLRDLGRARTAAWLVRLLRGALGRGDPGDDPAVERFEARWLLVRSAPTEDDELDDAEDPRRQPFLEATLDGSLAGFPAPVFVSAVDGALRIRVPA